MDPGAPRSRLKKFLSPLAVVSLGSPPLSSRHGVEAGADDGQVIIHEVHARGELLLAGHVIREDVIVITEETFSVLHRQSLSLIHI